MTNIHDYFFPKRKLHRIPKHITAQYARDEITKAQAIIMMAGLARDPIEAQSIYIELKQKHGDKIWQYVEFNVRRKRTGTFQQRLMKLMRKIFGEMERPNLRYRVEEPIVNMDYRIRKQDDGF
ncbi:MAG: hypothetical protein AAF846_22215 [Chloroflexota bacterium]